ncbi:MAG: superoxide dismutase family protein [Clostridia bacterium]|nr:superoxide dismutase family protein [Clostridia bacterium]
MTEPKKHPNFGALLNRRPQASAVLEGSGAYPNLVGRVRFWQTVYGALVVAEMMGLPDAGEPCSAPIFGLHIHEGEQCDDTGKGTFSGAGGHYNPEGCPHPYHAGDLPPIFSSGGYAFSMFLTDRFTVNEVVGRTVILHRSPDDFTTQPAGNAGARIACGRILR